MIVVFILYDLDNFQRKGVMYALHTKHYMTEISVSARIPEDIFKELKTFMKEESLEKSASIRKLLSEGLQHWKEQQAFEYLK